MTQAILEKINNNILQLQTETEFLRSFIIGFLGKDEEGVYNPAFVKRIIQIAKKDGGVCFENRTKFFKKIRS